MERGGIMSSIAYYFKKIGRNIGLVSDVKVEAKDSPSLEVSPQAVHNVVGNDVMSKRIKR